MPANTARISELDLLHPVVRNAVQEVFAQLEKEEIPFRVFESFRSPERQRMLYAQGRTAPGPRVTKAQPWSSYHQYGLAADFVLFIDGKWSWDDKGPRRKYWQRLHEIARAHGLEPLSWELPHLQYVGTTIEKLRAGDYPSFGDDSWADNLATAIEGWDGKQPAAPPLIAISRRPALPHDAQDVDAGDAPTFGRVSQSTGDAVNEQPEQGLTEAIIHAAQASERMWGVPASVTLAQFILESARGTRMPPQSNNPFGIKARKDEPFVLASTWEVVNGKSATVQAKFRKFATVDEAFSHHGKLLATSPHYVKAMAVRSDPVAFCNALTGVYATDPNYGKKLVQLISNYALTDYDRRQQTKIGGTTNVTTFAETDTAKGGLLLKFKDRGANVQALQSSLKAAGYAVGKVDGVYGTLTRAAVAAFQADNKLAVSGQADAATMELLNNSPMRPLERKRLETTEEDLRKDGSIIITQAQRTRRLGWLSSLFGVLGIGNSALVTAASSGSADVAASTFPISDFLVRIQTVLTNPTSRTDTNQLNQLAEAAADLSRGLKAGTPPDLAGIALQLKQLLPADIIARYPDLDRVLGLLSVPGTLANSTPRTILDLLPHNLVEPGGILSSVVASFVPGVGSSVIALGIGVLAHFFGARTAAARVQEHREGSNLSH